MKIRLNKAQYEYLKDHIRKEEQLYLQDYEEKVGDKLVNLNVDDEIAERIRDWAIEKQQKSGFDINYKLTSEGKILESLIDLFYV